MKNTTQKILELTRVLEKHGQSMRSERAFKLENTLRQLKRQRDLEAKRAYQAFVMGENNE
jgi:hypothetical protein